MSFNQQMDNENWVHIHGIFFNSKEKNEVFKYKDIQLQLESIILSEEMQIHKEKYHMFSYLQILALNLQI